MSRFAHLKPNPGYQERIHQQTLAWAEGRPYHNDVDDECCPDFSCCNPDLFTKSDAERWDTYKKQHDRGPR